VPPSSGSCSPLLDPEDEGIMSFKMSVAIYAGTQHNIPLVVV
jgi:hypothetical protein